MKLIMIPVLALLACDAGVALAQSHGTHSPHAGNKARDVKALSPDEVQGFLAGEGMGLALAAELNSYPGPRHVLDLARELKLSDSQAARIRAIYDDMHAAAVSLGHRYVERERELDRLFAGRHIDEARLAEITMDIGRLNSQLRTVHLRAHLRTTALLTPQQIQHYDEERGYAPGDASGGHDRRGHR